MTLEDVNRELEELEITDLSSAIKAQLLGNFKVWLEDEDIGLEKLDFKYANNLDEVVWDLESKCGDIISEYEEQNILNVYKDEEMER